MGGIPCTVPLLLEYTVLVHQYACGYLLERQDIGGFVPSFSGFETEAVNQPFTKILQMCRIQTITNISYEHTCNDDY